MLTGMSRSTEERRGVFRSFQNSREDCPVGVASAAMALTVLQSARMSEQEDARQRSRWTALRKSGAKSRPVRTKSWRKTQTEPSDPLRRAELGRSTDGNGSGQGPEGRRYRRSSAGLKQIRLHRGGAEEQGCASYTGTRMRFKLRVIVRWATSERQRCIVPIGRQGTVGRVRNRPGSIAAYENCIVAGSALEARASPPGPVAVEEGIAGACSFRSSSIWAAMLTTESSPASIVRESTELERAALNEHPMKPHLGRRPR